MEVNEKARVILLLLVHKGTAAASVNSREGEMRGKQNALQEGFLTFQPET